MERAKALRVKAGTLPDPDTQARDTAPAFDLLGDLARIWPAPATDEQIALATGLLQYTASPRRNELVQGGWVEDSGKRGVTASGSPAIAWTLTARAEDILINSHTAAA